MFEINDFNKNIKNIFVEVFLKYVLFCCVIKFKYKQMPSALLFMCFSNFEFFICRKSLDK